MATEIVDVLEKLSLDGRKKTHTLIMILILETLKPIFQEGFDPKAFSKAVIQCQAIGETLQKLNKGISELDKELYSQVRGYL